MSETGKQWRTLEDFQRRLRQLLEAFPEDSHPEIHGVLGLVTGMALQVRVPCDHCSKLTPAAEPTDTGQVLDFTAAQRHRQKHAEVAPVHPMR